MVIAFKFTGAAPDFMINLLCAHMVKKVGQHWLKGLLYLITVSKSTLKVTHLINGITMKKAFGPRP